MRARSRSNHQNCETIWLKAAWICQTETNGKHRNVYMIKTGLSWIRYNFFLSRAYVAADAAATGPMLLLSSSSLAFCIQLQYKFVFFFANASSTSFAPSPPPCILAPPLSFASPACVSRCFVFTVQAFLSGDWILGWVVWVPQSSERLKKCTIHSTVAEKKTIPITQTHTDAITDTVLFWLRPFSMHVVYILLYARISCTQRL